MGRSLHFAVLLSLSRIYYSRNVTIHSNTFGGESVSSGKTKIGHHVESLGTTDFVNFCRYSKVSVKSIIIVIIIITIIIVVIVVVIVSIASSSSSSSTPLHDLVLLLGCQVNMLPQEFVFELRLYRAFHMQLNLSCVFIPRTTSLLTVFL